MAQPSDYSDLKRNADDWLWIPYRKWILRWRARRDRLKSIEAYRAKSMLAMRRMRERQRLKAINDGIASVYWHEVHHPTIPISQYR